MPDDVPKGLQPVYARSRRASKNSTPRMLSHATLRLVCQGEDAEVWGGTGFLFDFAKDGNADGLAVVTNRHILEEAVRVTTRLTHVKAGTDEADYGNITSEVLADVEGAWIDHPDDDIDLAALPISECLLEARKRRLPYFVSALTPQDMLSDEELKTTDAMSEVIMVGYPDLIEDSVNNMPVFRKGICATHPHLNYDGNPDFLTDIASYPGSSGSPVFLHRSLWPLAGGKALGPYTKLLGIHHSGMEFTTSGDVDVVTPEAFVSQSKVPMHIGIAVRCEKLRELGEAIQSQFGFELAF
ncbi:hypothetical protein KOR34_53190 [Posidoniimonas corsicana]|uniref:Trypsin n=1 Tax=Posidoniimonas corsicana TaxID=1938618 RepID=A0A5C5UUH9_9BACT|nr:serine protease [Posidoniimonas corsicana]TWT29180.1 hypothetical protein KOR34_53190 [Posidoniimonas corsicana]